MGGKTLHSYARFSGSKEGLLSPNVCVRKIIVGSDVVDGHLDTCATHCFVSHHRSKLLQGKGYPPIKIKPFPIGQGVRLPDATAAHLAPLRLVSENGQIVGFGTVLFLVSNTGGDILIANNILDFLGILRYHPPIGYEQILQDEARFSFIPQEKRSPPSDIKQETLQSMLRDGQCLFTKSTTTETAAQLPPFKIRLNETYVPEVQTIRRKLSPTVEAAIQNQLVELEAAGTICSAPEISKIHDNGAI
jgi:hypothetical protein